MTSILPGDLVPKSYSFAMVTKNHIHFLRKLDGLYAFGEAKALCKADGDGHVAMDDQGRDWHERVAQRMGSDDSWLGGEDIDEDGVFTWPDGR